MCARLPKPLVVSKRELLSIPLFLFHGLYSSPQEFAFVGQDLRRRGLPHDAVVTPGYTLSTEAVSPDWRRWRDAALAAVHPRLAGDAPVVLGGLCMGGVLAAALALEAPRNVAGLVLMSPTFAYDGWGLPLRRHLRHVGYWTRLDRFFSVAEREPYGIKNAKIRKWVIRDLQERANSAVGPARLPLRALREGERMMAEVRARLGELRCPLLVIHAREDEITSLDSVQRLFASLPQPDKELAVLENSHHMITIDNDRHEVAALLAKFVTRLAAARTPASPRGANVLPFVGRARAHAGAGRPLY
jgi:carboxylesterase